MVLGTIDKIFYQEDSDLNSIFNGSVNIVVALSLTACALASILRAQDNFGSIPLWDAGGQTSLGRQFDRFISRI